MIKIHLIINYNLIIDYKIFFIDIQYIGSCSVEKQKKKGKQSKKVPEGEKPTKRKKKSNTGMGRGF